MNPETSRSRRGNRFSAGLLLLLLAAAVQFAAIRLGRIAWTSDQAVVGLMGRHIASGESHPVFYYGSAYAGTLESHVMAAVFRLFGSSVWTYRLTLMFFLAILVGLVYATARRAFGLTAAVASAAYLAVAPYYLLYKGLTSDGAYTSLAALTAGILYGSVRMDEAVERGRKTGLWFGFTGLAAGLGWWVDPLIGGVFVGVLVWFAVARPGVYRRLGDLGVFASGFLLGSLPWLVGNVGKGWPSLTSPSILWLAPPEAVKQFVRFWTVAVPVLFGARPFTGQPDVFPGAAVLAFLVYAVPVALAVYTVFRHRRSLREPGTPDAARARLLLLPLLTILGMHALVAWHPYSYSPEPRYLLPIYGPFALLFGYAFSRAADRLPKVLVATGAAALAAFNLYGLARAPLADDFRLVATSTLDPLVKALEERQIRDVYVSYWIGYRLAFESRERIRAASFGTGTARIERYPPYLAAVSSSKSPGVVLMREEAAAFERYLANAGRHADRAEVGPYAIYWNIDPATLRDIRSLRQVPGGTPG